MCHYSGAIVFDTSSPDGKWSVRLRFPHYQRNLLPDHFKDSFVYEWGTESVAPNGLAPVTLRHPRLSDGGLPGKVPNPITPPTIGIIIISTISMTIIVNEAAAVIIIIILHYRHHHRRHRQQL